MKIVIASIVAGVVLSVNAPQNGPVDYRFEQVRRTVTLTTPKLEMPVQAGQTATSGDHVQTGWFSYALIASDKHRAKFELFSSTEVQLAGGTPGVILSLERGRLHAIFDKITGSEPRIVQTPGALLAVRGTQYDVMVDDGDHTTLNVTEGIVEVRSPLRGEPLFVRAGQSCIYDVENAPVVRMSPRGMFDPDRGREPRGRGEGGRGETDEHGHGPGMMPPPGGTTPPPPPPPRPHP